ncbi:MAG TPA: hypothetical protein VF895_08250 [Gaiellaceae bacterium]
MSPSWGIALDDGSPPYPLPFPRGLITYSPSALQKDGWLPHKTIWVAPVDLLGPVLVRGRQLGGRNVVKFSGYPIQAHSALRLRFSGREFAGGWQEGQPKGYTLVRAPGCYGLQVDGEGFSEVLVFEARRVSGK